MESTLHEIVKPYLKIFHRLAGPSLIPSHCPLFLHLSSHHLLADRSLPVLAEFLRRLLGVRMLSSGFFAKTCQYPTWRSAEPPPLSKCLKFEVIMAAPL